jgi:hypothetical protein
MRAHIPRMYLMAAMLTFIVFCVVDCVAYSYAKFPERTMNGLYKLPGGGFMALWMLGR